MTFNITKDGNKVKTISAKDMDSIYNEFNTYATSKCCTPRAKSGAIGVLVWAMPSGEILELVKVY